MARHRVAATGSGSRAWHPADLPKGYHAAAQGQSYTAHTRVASRAAPGPPRGRTASSRQDATRTPTYKICDPYPCRRVCRETPDPESDAWQQGRPPVRARDQRSSRSTSAGTSTTTDDRGHPRTQSLDKARPRTNVHVVVVLLPTTDQMDSGYSLRPISVSHTLQERPGRPGYPLWGLLDRHPQRPRGMRDRVRCAAAAGWSLASASMTPRSTPRS
jgi:hypothetical protein